MYLLATVCEFIVESAVSFSVLVKNKSSLSLSAYRKHKKIVKLSSSTQMIFVVTQKLYPDFHLISNMKTLYEVNVYLQSINYTPVHTI